jgi:hypothetical protein
VIGGPRVPQRDIWTTWPERALAASLGPTSGYAVTQDLSAFKSTNRIESIGLDAARSSDTEPPNDQENANDRKSGNGHAR